MLPRKGRGASSPIFSKRVGALSVAVVAGILAVSLSPAPANAVAGRMEFAGSHLSAGDFSSFLSCVGNDGCRWRFCGWWGYHRHCNVFIPRHARHCGGRGHCDHR